MAMWSGSEIQCLGMKFPSCIRTRKDPDGRPRWSLGGGGPPRPCHPTRARREATWNPPYLLSDRPAPGVRRAARPGTSVTAAGSPSALDAPPDTVTVSRDPASGTRSTRRSPSAGGSAGANQSRPSGTSGSKRSSGAEQQERTGCRPGLRRARRRVGHRPSERRSGRSRRTARAGGRRSRPPPRAVPRDPLGLRHEAVAHQPGGDHRVVVRPDRAVVVAHRVVGAHRRGQRAHAPAGEHLRADQRAPRPRRPCPRRRCRSTGSGPCSRRASRPAACRASSASAK